MKKIVIGLFVVGTTFSVTGNSGTTRISKNDYIETWKETAVQNMIQYGIPASITMAQGILESSYGNSDLATEANNHFGIKCHNSWTGKKFYHDDDKKDECFRKYTKAAESYKDHSVFLTSYTRYAFLFQLSKTDYKAWARGLKKAGYATNPQYANLLIEAIETNNLAQLDQIGSSPFENNKIDKQPNLIVDSPKSIDLSESAHTVKIHANKVRYIIAKKGDTFFRIAQEFELGLWQLYRYNDFEKHKDVLEIGDIVYLQPKKFHAKGKRKSITLTNKSTLQEISQAEAIRIQSLMRMNTISSEEAILTSGSKIILKR
jgi:LysM repeat protein